MVSITKIKGLVLHTAGRIPILNQEKDSKAEYKYSCVLLTILWLV